jgi:ABC-2 type transport system permease protein
MSGAAEVIAAVARRTWTVTWRRPVVLTFSLGQPLVWMLFFGFLFHRFPLVDLPAGTSYLDFLAPGVSAMTVLFGASQAGIGWIRDLQTGFLPRLLNTPASPGAILAGKLLADVLRLLLQSAAVLVLAILLGAEVRFAPAALAAGLCLALFAAAFSCLSCAVALRARAQESMAAFVHLVNMPLLFTSTALVPHREMPAWLAAAAGVNPLSLTVDAWRGALLLGETPSVLTIGLLAVFAAALFFLALGGMRAAARLY